MPILAQGGKIATMRFGDEEIDLSTFTPTDLQTVLQDIQALMKANNALRKAGKRDVLTTIRVESIYVGLNRQVQEVLAYRLTPPTETVSVGDDQLYSLLEQPAA